MFKISELYFFQYIELHTVQIQELVPIKTNVFCCFLLSINTINLNPEKFFRILITPTICLVVLCIYSYHRIHSLQSTVYSLQSTVYSLQSTVYSLQSTVYSLQSNKLKCVCLSKLL